MTTNTQPEDPQPGPAAARYTIEERPAQPYVYTSHQVSMADLAGLASEIPRVLGGAVDLGLTLVGPPLWRYRVIDMARLLTVEVGVAVADAAPVVAAGSAVGLEAGVLPAGRYVTTVHVGPPDTIIDAVRDLLAWSADQGLTFDVTESADGDVWGSRLETYLTDPRDEPDMDRWESELAFRLADEPA